MNGVDRVEWERVERVVGLKWLGGIERERKGCSGVEGGVYQI